MKEMIGNIENSILNLCVKDIMVIHCDVSRYSLAEDRDFLMRSVEREFYKKYRKRFKLIFNHANKNGIQIVRTTDKLSDIKKEHIKKEALELLVK